MSQEQLPNTWAWAKLGNICLPVKTVDFSKRATPHFHYIDIASIDREHKIIANTNLIENTNAPSRARQIVLRDDVLVSTVRPVLNTVAIVPEIFDNEICSTGFCVLRADRNILDINYLFAWVRTPTFIENLTRLERGIGYPAVSHSDIENTYIPLPPLPEQRRIAAILHEADAIRQLRQQANAKTQQIAEALFYEMFGDPETNPKKWEKKSLSQLGMLDRGRSQHRPRDAAHLYNGPYPFIQTGNIANSNGWITQYSQTYSEAGLNQSRLWPKGTLCITIAANIAKTAVLTFDACFPDSIVGFTPDSQATIEYIRQWFVIIQNKLEQFAPQAAQKNINLDTLRKLTLPIPPKDLQDNFSIKVQNIYIMLEEQKTAHKNVEKIVSSLLAQAFTGELTAVWREQHREELAQAARERDALLRRQVTLSVEAHMAEAPVPERDERRADLLEHLSQLQRTLLDTFVRNAQTYFTAKQLYEDYEEELQANKLNTSLDQAQRELRTLATLGLIRELALPVTDTFGRVSYATVYRYPQPEDETMSEDLALLMTRSI